MIGLLAKNAIESMMSCGKRLSKQYHNIKDETIGILYEAKDYEKGAEKDVGKLLKLIHLLVKMNPFIYQNVYIYWSK